MASSAIRWATWMHSASSVPCIIAGKRLVRAHDICKAPPAAERGSVLYPIEPKGPVFSRGGRQDIRPTGGRQRKRHRGANAFRGVELRNGNKQIQVTA